MECRLICTEYDAMWTDLGKKQKSGCGSRMHPCRSGEAVRTEVGRCTKNSGISWNLTSQRVNSLDHLQKLTTTMTMCRQLSGTPVRKNIG